MSTGTNDVGVIGLGVMGQSLARNFARNGFRVAGFDLDPEAGARLQAAEPGHEFAIAKDTASFVASLERPRRILMMVNAGKAVDAVLSSLEPYLEEDDIVVDGGNSLFHDTDRRNALADGQPWRFVGMGVSGGEKGALEGPSMMPGGDREAWERLQPALEKIAAVGQGGPCVTHCGTGSAGHFVKMVHNGIEYGDMQLIAETAALLRRGMGKGGDEVAEIFEAWNEGELESYLVEITGKIFRTADPQDADALLVDAILDQAGQKGTGRWTVLAAVEMGIPIPTVAAAVDARGMSSFKALRVAAEPAVGLGRRRVTDVSTDDLRDALYCAKVASYAQGFWMLRAASEEKGYGTDLAEIARIWTAGCIIRARFLGPVGEALREAPERPLAMAPAFAEELRRRAPAFRRVVSAGARAGVPIQGLSASLAWLDTLTTADGTANVIQAQRDFFGSHTFRRKDAPDVPVHHPWDR
ncbi:MAG: NADP-dependent phosphogluconate dehydrogenase [Myxococcota bacterium]